MTGSNEKMNRLPTSTFKKGVHDGRTLMRDPRRNKKYLGDDIKQQCPETQNLLKL